MRITTSTYRSGTGWSTPLPGDHDGPSTLVLAFSAPEFVDATAPFAQLRQTFPQAVLAGCSSAGEIAGAEVFDASISVAIAHFEHCSLRRAWTEVAGAEDSEAAGSRLARQLAAPQDDRPLRAVFLLSDGLSVNGTRLVAGISSQLPQGVSVSGGLAGDGSRFSHTWILDADACPQARAVCAVGFYGERLRVGQGCEGGWSDFGPERRITRSSGNVLFELDDKPALALYRHYLGDRASELPGAALLFPLAIRREGQTGEPLVRTILAIDNEQQSMTFAGDVPQGALARLMRANTDKLIGSAARAAKAAVGEARGADHSLLISVSCVGRRLVLGQRTEDEVEGVADSAPGCAGHLGLYAYGEIARTAGGESSDLHNQTMTVTVLGESADDVAQPLSLMEAGGVGPPSPAVTA